ncbi:MAG TPA: FtsX-like permease family protein [Gaiellaceae bacterium]|nr:FtsX-like permease family protein [Gaiellaceae bacterium]
MSSSVHRIRASLAVTAARLRAQPLRPVLVVGGTLLAFATLVTVLGGSLVARQQALARSLAAVPESERVFRLDRFGLPLDARSYRRTDRRARRALAALGGGETRREIVFRELRVGGELVQLAAVDGLASAVRLRSGRLPRRCASSGCELLQVGADGAAALDEGDLHLRRVGTAELRDPALLGDLAAATGSRRRPTLLLAASVAALQRLPAAAPYYRVYSWVSPLRVDGLRTWEIGRVLHDESRAQAALEVDSAFRLSGPDQPLLDARSRGRIAADRLVLVGGETSALLLGFAVVAAIGLRRGLAGERRRLLVRGARRWQVALLSGAEVGAMTLAGAVAGLLAGAAAVAAIAGAAGVGAWAIVAHTLLAARTVAALAGAWLATTAVLALATHAREHGDGGRRIRVADVAALGAAATVAVGVGRGALDPSTVSSGDAVLFLILPALVCFVVALVLARLLAPAMRLAERLTRRSAFGLRLAVLALARAPSRTVVSCAFVAVALGLALFAATYRATLARGAADQASFQVPLDFTVAESPRLVAPLDAAPLSRYAQVGGAAAAYPVLRLGATVPGAGSAVLSPTVLGLPAAAVRRLRWRGDFSSLSPGELARRLAASGEPRLAGVRLPAGTARVTLPVRVSGPGLSLALVVRDGRGRTQLVQLGRAGTGASVVGAGLPAGGPLDVVGLQLTLPLDEQFFFAHVEAEGSVSSAPAGAVELGPLRASGGRAVTAWKGWSLRAGGAATRSRNGVRFPFAFPDTGARLVLRPREPTDGRALPVVVSPDVADAAGGVGSRTRLDFQDVEVPVRIAGVASRLPTVPASSGPFVLADEAWLETAVGADAPGEGDPNEVWLSTPDEAAAAAALRRPPFAALAVTSRTAIERQLTSDPLARATGRALGAAALVALVLAVLGFWVGVLSEVRDERSDFFDLEAQGVAPARLRAQLRTRSAILVAAGLAGGAALGALLSTLVVSLVRISATTALPEPPLSFDPAWLESGLAVAVLAVAALAVAEGTSLAAFRGARPERASWSLE